jgi:hypothetical protein
MRKLREIAERDVSMSSSLQDAHLRRLREGGEIHVQVSFLLAEQG